MVMAHIHAKNKVKGRLKREQWKQMDMTDFTTFPANAVGKNIRPSILVSAGTGINGCMYRLFSQVINR